MTPPPSPNIHDASDIKLAHCSAISALLNSQCSVQNTTCDSFKSWKTRFSLQFLQLPHYISQGNLPIVVLHIGHMCYAKRHRLTLDDFCLFRLLPSHPPSLAAPLFCFLSSLLYTVFSHLHLRFPWIVIVMERLIRHMVAIGGRSPHNGGWTARANHDLWSSLKPSTRVALISPHCCLTEVRPRHSGSHFGLIT